MISVVVPTLNAQTTLSACLMSLYEPALEGVVRQVIVADGGSDDMTREIADDAGCEIIESKRGRGTQLDAGAAAAKGDWLLFLHADTVLERGWEEEVLRFANRYGQDKAAVFHFALDDDSWKAYLLEKLVWLRVTIFGLPYGDQGLLISRTHYRRLGGYKNVPIMEDVDMIRRIGRRSIKRLKSRATTSAVRYRHAGYLKRMVRNLGCLTLYRLGVSPETIVKYYG